MSVPSLRQKQINEVLDYHRLINRTVFDRNVKSVFASNQSKAEPHRTDIETEANLRDRVDKIKTILQQIIQFTSYGETSIDPTTGGESKEGTMEGRTNDTSATFLKSRSDTALASLLSEYNGICGIYDLKNRAHVFSESESTALTGIVRELKEPLIATIGTLMANKGKNKSYFQYYRVIKTVMDNIDTAPPFLKIQPSLLTEPYFIPDPSKVKVVDGPLWKHMLESRDEVVRKLEEYQTLVASSETEKQAKHKSIDALTKVVTRIDDLIKTNKKALRDYDSGSYDQAYANTESLSSLFADKTVPQSLRNKIKDLHAAFEHVNVALEDVDDPDEVEKMFKLFFDDPASGAPYTEKKPDPTDESGKIRRICLEEDKVNLEQRISDIQKELDGIFAGKTASNPIVTYRILSLKKEMVNKTKILKEINLELDTSAPPKHLFEGHATQYDYDSDGKPRLDKFNKPILKSQSSDTGLTPLAETFSGPYEAHKEDSVTRQFRREIADLTRRLDYRKKLNPRSQQVYDLEDEITGIEQKLLMYQQTPAERDTYDKEGNLILYDGEDNPYYIDYVDGTENVVYYEPGDKRLDARPKPAGYPKGKGKPRKKGGNDFADDSVLAPYLTKHLKPSKFTKPKPESESDNPDDGTSEEEGGKKPTRKKRSKKPLIDNKRDEDLWFM